MWFYFNVFRFTGVFIRVVVLMYISACTCQINVFTLSQKWNWPDSHEKDGQSQSIKQMALRYSVFTESHHFVFMMPDCSRWYHVGLLELKLSAVEKHLASLETHALKTRLPADSVIICYCNARGTVFSLLTLPFCAFSCIDFLFWFFPFVCAHSSLRFEHSRDRESKAAKTFMTLCTCINVNRRL